MHIPPLKPEVLFNLGPLPITNSFLTSIIAALILCLAAIIVGKSYKRLPSGLQHIFEMVYEMFENLSVDALGKSGRSFVPFIATLFLFIIMNNWLGVLPGVGSLTITPKTEHVVAATAGEHATEAKPAEGAEAAKATEGEHSEAIPLFRGGNADLNMTFALALISMVVIHVSGIRSAGLGHHLAHFKNPLEIVSELGKILSYSFRLFGNVFAGEVLLAAMGGIIAIVTKNTANTLLGIPGGLIATPFFLFELFVGFIQAFVFAVLTISFLSLFYKGEGSHAAH
jgi:F-type H+-transporting ATPase subunit a